MTDRISEIRVRCDKAMSGPWKHIERAGYSVIDIDAESDFNIAMVGSSPADAIFIAHARTDIPYLLDRLAELEKENEVLEGADIALDAQTDEVERLREAQRWVPVSERLPGHRDAIKNGDIEAVDKRGDYHFIHWSDFRVKIDKFTHWQPLPEPPEDTP